MTIQSGGPLASNYIIEFDHMLAGHYYTRVITDKDSEVIKHAKLRF